MGAHGWSRARGVNLGKKKRKPSSWGSVSANKVQGVSYMGSGVYIWMG